MGHFRDEYFLAVNCTGTDKQTRHRQKIHNYTYMQKRQNNTTLIKKTLSQKTWTTGPTSLKELLIWVCFIWVCLWQHTTAVHNTALNSSDNCHSYLQTIITAQMLLAGMDRSRIVIEHGLTSHQTHHRSYWGQLLQVIWPNQQCQSTEGSQLVFQIRPESHQEHSTMLQ